MRKKVGSLLPKLKLKKAGRIQRSNIVQWIFKSFLVVLICSLATSAYLGLRQNYGVYHGNSSWMSQSFAVPHVANWQPTMIRVGNPCLGKPGICATTEDYCQRRGDEMCHWRPSAHTPVIEDYEWPVFNADASLIKAEGKWRNVTHSVTIVTQVSFDRMWQLEAMCQVWNGPISVAVQVFNPMDAYNLENWVIEMLSQNSELGLIVSVLYSKPQDFFPINNLRNLALEQAVTAWVFLLDGDFMPSYNLHSELLRLLPSDVTLKSKNLAQMDVDSANADSSNNNEETEHNDGDELDFLQTMLVIAALESSLSQEQLSERVAANSVSFRKDLNKWVDEGTWRVFHEETCAHCHKPSNYARLLQTKRGQMPYSIEYHSDYEPYIVVRRAGLHRYDGRFRGYGFDKIAHMRFLKDCRDFEFRVMPHAFVVTAEHAPSKWRKKFLDRKSAVNALTHSLWKLKQKYELPTCFDCCGEIL